MATRPGLMCKSPTALATLTMPDGSSRTSSPYATSGDEAIKQQGGCIDIPLGVHVNTVSIRANTSIVMYDPEDGGGPITYIVPNVDFLSADRFDLRTTGRPLAQVPLYQTQSSLWYSLTRSNECIPSPAPNSPADQISYDRRLGLTDTYTVLRMSENGAPAIVRVEEPAGNGLVNVFLYFRNAGYCYRYRSDNDRELLQLR